MIKKIGRQGSDSEVFIAVGHETVLIINTQASRNKCQKSSWRSSLSYESTYLDEMSELGTQKAVRRTERKDDVIEVDR
jgi:hypothetical protein